MEEIIKKAIKGGWNSCSCGAKSEDSHFQHCVKGKPSEHLGWDKSIVLDPLFFQALGKACGWDERKNYTVIYKGKNTSIEYGIGSIPEYQLYALRFHEINLTEGFESAISYLQTLVNKHG